MIFTQTRSGDMWTTEHSIEASVDAQAIWRAWADVPGWPKWNGDIEHVELTGPFATGSTIAMTPRGQDPYGRQWAFASALGLCCLTRVLFVLWECVWWIEEEGCTSYRLQLAREACTDVKMTSPVARNLEAKGLIDPTVNPADTRARRL